MTVGQFQSRCSVEEMVSVRRLVSLFNSLFSFSHNTILVIGDDEPLYVPSNEPGSPHKIIFAHGFFSSALHETAHWCIAGKDRLNKQDFGYWYQPSGRTLSQQALFESVEAKPQALEWIFTKATGRVFRLSVDNLDQCLTVSDSFKYKVYACLCDWWKMGLGSRGELWMRELANTFNGGILPSVDDFCYSELS